MAEKKDLYAMLGVARDAKRDEIRSAYRKLARQNHPDLNPGDEAAEERFKEISNAWGVLSDETKRSHYDEFGEVALDAGFDPEEARKVREEFGSRFGFGGAPRGAGPEDGFHFADIDDLLGQMFARQEGAGPTRQFRGADLEASLDLEFLEAVRGGEKRLTLGRAGVSGGTTTDTVTIRIPPGVGPNGRLRVPGKGAPGVGGGPAGDLWVSLRIRPHPVFRRDGKNLSLDLPITVREAIAGAVVEVPTLDGRAQLTIPAGTDGGKRLRLKGKGVPASGKEAAGDLLVRVQIKVPKDLDEEAQAALEALEPFEDPSIRKELFS